ncbi:hypothetical protein RD110_12395 [Rhodoferax koreense]|uniref:GGDEF domain-containing protein n=2 Tax=Rhodoferax koreensis TaxID=1842727 RepID=A0A1P8K3U1_9BURK|nr:hypothetical protein RD110_12395 [Rhodoferax koreense]
MPAVGPALLYSLLVNSAVSLIIGVALLLVWRHHRRQRFTFDLGLAHLVQVLVPLCLLAVRSSGAWSALGQAGGMVCTVAYTGLMVVGIGGLSQWSVAQREWLVLVALLALAGLAALVSGLALLTASLAPIFNTLVGVVATRRLWRGHNAERLVGPLLLALGLSQFGALAEPDIAQAWQLSLGSVLRVALGLSLVYAALERSTEEIRRLRDRYRRLIEHSHQGVLVRAGDELLYANAAVLETYGYENQAQMSLPGIERALPAVERERLRHHMRQLQNGEVDEIDWEGVRVRRDGTPMWLRFTAWRTLWDERPATQILVTNQTAQHDATHALLHQAMHDDLTGLPNRAALLQQLRERCAKVAEGEGGAFGLVLLGVDRFKLFNEAHGHSLGDEVLKALGQALQRELGGDAQVMRIGADEFAWLVTSDGALPDAAALVARLRHLLRQPMVLRHHRFFLDASMGMALCPDDAGDAEALLRAANAAMHVAKRTPGTSMALAEARFALGSSDLLAQEQALRTAIVQRQFSLHYQPKVEAWSGRLIGFEALARWQRPGFGPVGPGEFIATAERTGLIGELGEMLLRLAFEQVKVWRDAFDRVVPVAVNVSPLQMLDGEFPRLVTRMLDEHGLPPQAITLELTESAAVANLDLARDQILQLRRLGVEVALDDFGTGFSSLNMLRSLPVHTVKIDRGLIEPLPAPDALAVVRAICQLATALDLQVIAEGVENEAQADAARQAGCQVLQGELFAQPLTLGEAGDWLSESVSDLMRLT